MFCSFSIGRVFKTHVSFVSLKISKDIVQKFLMAKVAVVRY